MNTNIPERASVLIFAALAMIPSLSNDLSTPFIGVPLTTIAGAVLGTYGAIGYDDTAQPRGKLFTRALSTTILAGALVGVVPKWLGWSWSSGGVEAALAALAAAVIYYTMGPATKRARELIAGFTLSDLLPFRKGTTPPADNPPTPGEQGPPEK